MSRVDKARQAYLQGDISRTQLTHSRETIHRSIHHQEAHLTSFNLPQVILGGQDGLVNVLGIILGVAAATSSRQIVIIAGLSATFAESISMAAVAYTSKLAEADYYQSELERERWEIDHIPAGEKEEIRALYENYGFKGKILADIVDKITSDKKNWLNVMMEQELKLEPVERKEALPTSIIVGVSAIIGSLIPLFPFFFFSPVLAMFLSLTVTSITLFALGFYKAKMTLGRNLSKMGFEMLIIGMTSALAGFVVGKMLEIKH